MNVLKKKNKISFFDFPEKKKKEIISVAAKGSNKLQLALVKEYDRIIRNKNLS